MQRFLHVLIVLALLVLFVAPVAAQDAPAPVPPVFTAPDINEVLNAGLIALLAAFSTGILSPLTSPIVSILKRLTANIPFFTGLSGDHWNLLVALILSLLVWGATSLGFAQELNTVYRLLYAILPIVTGIGANYAGNKAVYSATKGSVPIVGYSRSA